MLNESITLTVTYLAGHFFWLTPQPTTATILLTSAAIFSGFPAYEQRADKKSDKQPALSSHSDSSSSQKEVMGSFHAYKENQCLAFQ